MKLLVLDQFSEPGGAQRMLMDLLDAVRDRGWEVLLGAPASGALIDHARGLGFECISIQCGPYASTRKSAADLRRWLTDIVPLARAIRNSARSFQPDLIYINGPRLLPAAALAHWGRPVLFHAHITVSQSLARALAGLALRILRAHVVAVCQLVAGAWRPYVGRERLAVVHNGVRGPAHDHRRTRVEAPRIGCIGRIAPEKGQMEFLAAAAKIRSALPQSRFLVCGAPLFADPVALSYEHQLRNAARDLPVEFTGWVSDADEILARLDLLLVPSLWPEANPRVILEAFAAGVPVIAFRAGGVPEIIEHGRNGFLCDSIDEMVQIALDLLRDPTRLCAISQAAHESWRVQFTLERWQSQMLEIIERAANGS